LAKAQGGLGEHRDQLVSETTYLTADPTIDSQMVTMRESGADLWVLFGDVLGER
jgi:branched-chain amino acid transport system substrate-binding protein